MIAAPLFKALIAPELEKHRAVPVSDTHPDALKLVACGQSWCDQVLRIVDPEKQEALPEGQIGEIWIQGSHVAKGYWQQPELTQEAFGATLPDMMVILCARVIWALCLKRNLCHRPPQRNSDCAWTQSLPPGLRAQH